MNIQMLKGRTLLRLKLEEVSGGGIILLDTTYGAPSGVHRGEVVSTSSEEGVEVGDIVLWRPHRGRKNNFDGEDLYLALDGEILGIIKTAT